MKQRPSVITVLSGTKMPRGGLTGSALNRVTQLAERGYDVQICTFDYRPDFEDHVQDLRDQGIIGKNVRMDNFYEQLRCKRISSELGELSDRLNTSSLVKQRESNRLTRFFSHSGQLMYTELSGAGRSLWRRYYTDTRVEKRRVEYSIKGTLHRETVFVENSPLISSVSYLDASGRAFFTQWMDAAGKPSDVFIAADAQSSTRFGSLEKAQENWFHSVVAGVDGAVVVMIDDCTMAPVVRNLHLPLTKHIAIFHNDHKSPAHKTMVDAMMSWDAVVCSTHGQARVLREVVPQSLSITAIGQAVPDRGMFDPRPSVSSSRFAYFGRLTSVKNVLPLVSTFRHVVNAIPTATLDIYGSGPQEAELKDLIEELNLQKNVRLMGRTNEPLARMAEYSATIVPSSFEAFGLVVGESMLAETPVIAFDCDFGPRDIITDGVDGILVELNDFSMLAEKIIFLSLHPEEAKEMGILGRKSVIERFSNEAIMTRWEQLIEDVADC